MASGIYKIANKITGDFYIGSAIVLNRRLDNHRSDLRKNRHTNKHLQNVFNKYGMNNLSFDIVEIISNENDLIIREQYYIDILKPSYNICKKAGSRLHTLHSKKSKIKMSISAKGRIPWNKGKHLSEETIIKKSKTFELISPSGEIVSGINIHRFCRERGLDGSRICRVLRGERNQHKGWTKG